MKVFIIVSLLILKVLSIDLSECGISSVHNFGNRIVGGREALKGEFPWMVSIQMWHFDDYGGSWYHQCGGSILNKQWILTAAHYKELDLESIRVVVGAHHLPFHGDIHFKESVEYSVKWWDIYPLYDSHLKQPKDDIALIRINGEFKSDGMVNNICLPKEDYTMSTTSSVTVIGWGHIEHLGDPSPVLLAVNLEVIPNNKCRKKIANIGSSVFCAGSYGKDSCQGDSGGPAIQMVGDRAFVVGIVSYGNVCGSGKIPAIYTEVSKYHQWIQDIIDYHMISENH